MSRVIGWQSEKLGHERRAGEPDHERTAELKEGLAQAQADRRSIPLADDEQRQRLIDKYSALYRRLTAQ
ncbi:hypothetical protein ACWCOW_41870 [Streptomyces sp. NPDC001939]